MQEYMLVQRYTQDPDAHHLYLEGGDLIYNYNIDIIYRNYRTYRIKRLYKIKSMNINLDLMII